MESSEELVFLGPGASWVLAFSCRNLGKKSYMERKQEGILGFSFLEGMSGKLPKCSFFFFFLYLLGIIYIGEGEKTAA